LFATVQWPAISYGGVDAAAAVIAAGVKAANLLH
jgi:hypothetical protein